MRFRAGQRLRRQVDFQHVRTHGRRHDCGAFLLWYARQAPAQPPELTGHESATAPAADSPSGSSAPTSAPALPEVTTARLGVVASRAAVGNAVQRAFAKRRLREVFRAHQTLVPPGHDILLIARGSLNGLEYLRIEQKFVDACRKIFPSARV